MFAIYNIDSVTEMKYLLYMGEQLGQASCKRLSCCPDCFPGTYLMSFPYLFIRPVTLDAHRRSSCLI